MMSQLVSSLPTTVEHSQPVEKISSLSPDGRTVFLASAVARIYHAQSTNKAPEWCYSRLKGTLVFGKDNEPNDHHNTGPRNRATTETSSYWFRLIDSVSGKPTWLFRIPAGFVYELNLPFFHSFQGKSRKFGFLFQDDEEAHVLAQKVHSHTRPSRPVKNRSLSLSIRNMSLSGSSRGQTFPPTISLPTPNSFVHVGHVGMSKEGIIQATGGIDSTWKAILEGHGWPDMKELKTEQLPISEGLPGTSRHSRSTKVA